MARRPDYYNRLTITSVPDPSSGFLSIPDYEKDMKAIVNQAVKSALSEGDFFKTSSRVVNSNTGETRLDVYVHPENANVVSDSILTELERLKYNGSSDSKYKLDTSITSKAETRVLLNEERSRKQETEYHRRNSGAIIKLVGLVTSLADIARRILSTVLNFSTQTVKDMTTAHNYGLSYATIRSYNRLEKAHNLKEGTITDAVSDIQTKFGNITNLDEKSLEALAVVMGGKIEEMATMGLGSSNPEAILGAILDSFNEKANAGYNSVGQYVGEQQARRELYSYLLRISPQIADIFATMQEEQHNINSIFRNQFETFEEWKGTINTDVRGGHVPSEQNITFTMGEEWGEVKKVLDDIKEHFILSFAPSVLSLLRALKDIRIGLSETQNREVNEENRKANEKEIKRVDSMIAKYGDTSKLNDVDKNYVEALKAYRQELVDANKGDIKGNIHPATRTAEEIRVLSNELAIKKIKGLDVASSTPTLYTKEELEEQEEKQLSMPSIDDIEKTLEDYQKFDLDKERGKYKAKLAKLNTQVDKTRKKQYEAKVKEIEDKNKNDLDKRVEEARKDYEGSPNYTPDLPRYAGISDKKEILEVLKRLYPEFTYDVGKGKEKDYIKALDKAVEQGYLTKEGKTYKYKAQEATAMEKNRAMAVVNQDNPYYVYGEQDFLYWLYGKNKGWFDKHIQGLQIDQLLKSSVTGGKLPSLFMLDEDTSWLNKVIPNDFSGSGTLYGVNDKSNGETVHKIMFVVDVNGEKRTLELGSFLGMEAYEGELGQMQIVRDGSGSVDWSVSLENTPSEIKGEGK